MASFHPVLPGNFVPVCGQRHLPLSCNYWILLGKYPAIPHPLLHFHSHLNQHEVVVVVGGEDLENLGVSSLLGIVTQLESQVSAIVARPASRCYIAPHLAVSFSISSGDEGLLTDGHWVEEETAMANLQGSHARLSALPWAPPEPSAGSLIVLNRPLS